MEYFRKLLFLASFLYCFSLPAQAQPVPEGVGFIDELIALDITPEKVFSLVEIAPGEVERYPAKFLDYYETIRYPKVVGDTNHWIVASPLTLPKETQSLTFTFFLIAEDGYFAGTPVVNRSLEQIIDERKPTSQLEEEVRQSRKKLLSQVKMLEGLDEELAELREKASKVVGIENIVDLNMELSELEGFSSELESEKERLEELIKIGRKAKQPANLAQKRRELQAFLKEAAKVTAMADRLNKKKKNAALSTLRKNISLVKQTSGYNLQLLSQEVLKLRRQRRKLEAQLNLATRGDQF